MERGLDLFADTCIWVLDICIWGLDFFRTGQNFSPIYICLERGKLDLFAARFVTSKEM